MLPPPLCSLADNKEESDVAGVDQFEASEARLAANKCLLENIVDESTLLRPLA